MPTEPDDTSLGFDPITSDQIDALAELADGPPATPATARRLRERFGDPVATRLLRTLELQTKARRKFGPGRWWVTSRGLQQATAWQVADYKAAWFGDRPVIDLCCGVGGDLMRLARRGPVTGIDADPDVAAMAAANLDAAGAGLSSGDGSSGDGPAASDEQPLAGGRLSAGVVCGDAIRWAGSSDAAVHIDPDRRPTTHDAVPRDVVLGRTRTGKRTKATETRTTSPDRFSPAWDDVERILERSGDGVAKLAPATRLDGPILERVHRCWIALGTTVREQSVLFGETIRRAEVKPATRSAVVIGADGRHQRFVEAVSGAAVGTVEPVQALGAMLVDPHAAIRAAGLTEAFAVACGLGVLAGPSGFLTTDADGANTDVSDPEDADGNTRDAAAESGPLALGPLAFAERIVWSGRFDDRGLRRAFRELDARPATVKVRGVAAEPEMLLKRYRKCGQRLTTLWLGRAGDGVFAAITRST